MVYSVAWNEAVPAGSAAANQIDTFIQNDKTATRERLESLFGITNFQTADPVKGQKLNLAAGAISSIVPGATSFAVRDSADARNNFLVNEIGDIVSHRNLAVGGQAKAARYTGVVVAATTVIDWNNGNSQILTLGLNIGTLTLNNPIAGSFYTIELKQDSTGGRTVNWPATVVFPSGVAPTLTTTADRTDIISLYYNGTNYAAIVAGYNFNV